MQRPYKEKTAAKAAALCNRSYFDLKVYYTTPRELSWFSYFGKLSSYHFARMRYFKTEVPSLATGTMNCAANAAVFVYLYEE